MDEIDDYIRMWDVTTSAIASADPTAKFMPAALAHLDFQADCSGGSGFKALRQFAYSRGTSVDAWSLHVYSSSLSHAQQVVSCFTQNVHKWKVSGYTNSDTVWITETGYPYSGSWEGTKNFIQVYLPWLENQSQVQKWMWWQWGEYSFLLDNNSNPTPVGLCYANLAHGLPCD